MKNLMRHSYLLFIGALLVWALVYALWRASTNPVVTTVSAGQVTGVEISANRMLMRTDKGGFVFSYQGKMAIPVFIGETVVIKIKARGDKLLCLSGPGGERCQEI